jgi:hypothetical protein
MALVFEFAYSPVSHRACVDGLKLWVIVVDQVVPMTHRVGVLEWVDGTRPVKGIIQKVLKSKAHPEKYLESVLR